MRVFYIEAPFAVCRSFTAGWYRPTATFLTPSSAYGLLLNLAGIETRMPEQHPSHPGSVPATLTQPGLPAIRLALGASTVQRVGRRDSRDLIESDRYPRVSTLYQQLHNYPVGTSGAERASTTFGNKYNITPVRREVLVDIRAIVAIDGNPTLESDVCRGLNGELATGRYGLPFVGDNSFLPDRIDQLDTVPRAHWYERIDEESGPVRPRTTRLSVWIDRADMSRTKSDLFAPTSDATSTIPEAAWTAITPP